MTLVDFQEQVNEWGRSRVPFLFLVDFEMERPLALRLDSINPNVFLYNFNGQTNVELNLGFDQQHIEVDPISFSDYEKKFAAVVKAINYGDSYLVNLTSKSRLKRSVEIQQLFHKAQAPYKIWWRDNFVFFSPETFVKIEAGKIFTHPMKGTIDASIPNAKEKILQDEKELAEHITIVDLLRNDIGKVATQVSVTRFRYIDTIKSAEKSIHQVSSEIVGVLPNNYNNELGDLLMALLPAGSISGAPKQKTLEIIRKVEGESRGYYTGVAGIFDGKNLDSCVMIRFIEQQGKTFIIEAVVELPHAVMPGWNTRKCSTRYMFPLFESIRLADGQFARLEYHERRILHSLQTLYKSKPHWKLESILGEQSIPSKGVFKCRVEYDAQQASIQIQPYQARSVKTLKIVHVDEIQYAHKFSNRAELDVAFAARGNADDILMVRQGLISDTSIANIVLEKNDTWFTPKTCLLPGTMRQFLLDQNQIQVANISFHDLTTYQHFKLINAMLQYDSPAQLISNII